MAIDEKTRQVFKETKTKLLGLFCQHMLQTPNDGHCSYALQDAEQKGVIIENKHGEKVFVPENVYNKCVGCIIVRHGRLEIVGGTWQDKFTAEDALWVGEIGYTLRDYEPQHI